jgi:DNA-directed RNA polymerase beta subunit
LFFRFTLSNGDESREEEISLGEIPIMSEQGSLISGGAERVIVSQLHRCTGICLEVTTDVTGKL